MSRSPARDAISRPTSVEPVNEIMSTSESTSEAPVVSPPERAAREAPKAPLAFQPPLPDDPGPEEVDEAQEGERKW